MDSEDLGEMAIAGDTLRARSDFSSSSSSSSSSSRSSCDSCASGPVSTANRLQTLLGAPKDSIGVQLLRQMGWREGHGVGPRTQGQTGTSTAKTTLKEWMAGRGHAPKDIALYRAKRKDNVYGLGYDPRVEAPDLAQLMRTSSCGGNQHNRSAQPSSGKGSDFKSRGSTLSGMIMTDEDEDVSLYGKEDMSHYDFELGDAPRLTSAQKRKVAAASSGRNPLVFVPPAMTESSSHKEEKKLTPRSWPRLVVPSDFVTTHRWTGTYGSLFALPVLVAGYINIYYHFTCGPSYVSSAAITCTFLRRELIPHAYSIFRTRLRADS